MSNRSTTSTSQRPSVSRLEHFVTLFDDGFLPLGMALHESLMTHARPFHLWVVCMNEKVEEYLARLELPHVSTIPLREVESAALIAVKGQRSRAEYCWTMTPVSCSAVLERCDEAERVTYLDSDVFFFADPRGLLDELDASLGHVLITEHAFAPQYDNTEPHGRFCVQFVTFRRTPEGRRVLQWWQDRCLEWCSAIPEDGRFGDQKYLDQWPDLFGQNVHILKQTHHTLAPWNVNHVMQQRGSRFTPVMYHFHNLRLLEGRRVWLFRGYRVGLRGYRLYRYYLKSLSTAFGTLDRLGMDVPLYHPVSRGRSLFSLPFRHPWSTERFACLKSRARMPR